MTTKRSGGRITGLLALTLEAQVALNVGDPVHVTGTYECALGDGTKPIVGHVSVANKKPQFGAATRDPEIPGEVTVEALGFYVRTVVSGGAFGAGVGVGYGAAGLVAAGAGPPVVPQVGVSLMASTAAGQKVDVLFLGAA